MQHTLYLSIFVKKTRNFYSITLRHSPLTTFNFIKPLLLTPLVLVQGDFHLRRRHIILFHQSNVTTSDGCLTPFHCFTLLFHKC